MHKLGGVQEGLRWDAAAMQACTAQLFLLDDRDLEAKLGSSDGADIPGGAATDDGYVERLIGHMSRLYRRSNLRAGSGRRSAACLSKSRWGSARPHTRLRRSPGSRSYRA